MFLEHFELNEQPFGVTADPRFFYLGSKHRAALNMLVTATQSDRRVLMLTAEPGMGKTCLLFHYVQGLRDDSKTAFLFQTAGKSIDILRYLLADLGLQSGGNDIPGMHAQLNDALIARSQAGQRFILVIDDAHHLHPQGFKSPVFVDFDKPWMKLIQIVVAGRPQLAEQLAEPNLAAFRAGISSCIRLTGFTALETHAYVDYRLRAAGYAGSRLFTPDAQLLIAMQSKGVPRYINSLCFNSMWIAYRMGAKEVDSEKVREAVADLVIDAQNLNGIENSAFNRIFAPLGSSSRPEWDPKSDRRMSRLAFPAAAFLFIVLSLVVVSGVFYRRTATYSPPADGQPTVGTTVTPAPNPSLAQTPVTMTNIHAAEAAPPLDASDASIVPVAAGPKDEAISHFTAPTSQLRRYMTVVVEPHATIRHLSIQYLGRFDPDVLIEIQRLNPSLLDPNYIQAQAKIRLPLYLRRFSNAKATAVADATPIALTQEKP